MLYRYAISVLKAGINNRSIYSALIFVQEQLQSKPTVRNLHSLSPPSLCIHFTVRPILTLQQNNPVGEEPAWDWAADKSLAIFSCKLINFHRCLKTFQDTDFYASVLWIATHQTGGEYTGLFTGGWISAVSSHPGIARHYRNGSAA